MTIIWSGIINLHILSLRVLLLMAQDTIILDGSNLPSVTTILKATQSEEDKAGIAAWKERVGHKEAERIKNEAANSRKLNAFTFILNSSY